ncbi:MAG: hypothetical protein WDN03_02320 [Rhizomicrobium sp.]
MKDLSHRFGDDESARKPPAPRPDPLARLHQPAPDEAPPEPGVLRLRLERLSRRADVLAALFALAAIAAIAWPRSAPAPPPDVAHAGDEVATLTVQPLSDNGTSAAPDWYALFNAYQLETALRDISIRCNYGLTPDARTDRYLHARLDPGTQIKIFLADPGTCPKL